MESFGNLCFSEVCHQQAERSLLINGKPMAVCARCAGIYFGFLGGWILRPALHEILVKRIQNELLWFLGFIPMTADFVMSHLEITTSSNTIRLWTGVVAGISVAFILLPQWMEVNFRKHNKRMDHGNA